jgi:hypothetical protein
VESVWGLGRNLRAELLLQLEARALVLHAVRLHEDLRVGPASWRRS